MSTPSSDGKVSDRPSQGVPSGDATLPELRGRQDDGAADREAYLAHELPAEWVTELEKPVPAYETELDGLMDEQEPEDGSNAEARECARRAARTMDGLSRGLTLDGLPLRELIGRDRP